MIDSRTLEILSKDLTITGESQDGKYVNLELHTAGEVKRIFKCANKAGIKNEDLVNPRFVEILFDGDQQPLHLRDTGHNKEYFFSKEAIEKMKGHYQIV